VLYEFAMTPDLFHSSVTSEDDPTGTTLVQLLRGIEKNGLLADLHKGCWGRHVTERIASLPDNLKRKVMDCLNILYDRHRLVRHPKCMYGDPASDPDWLNLALASHKRIPFHAIILSQALIDDYDQECDAFVEFISSPDSSQWLGRRQTLILTKCPDDYRKALNPLLRHAKSLNLVDPYLNSHESRYFETIKICSNVMGQRGHARLQGRIYIHSELENQRPYDPTRTVSDYLDAWSQKLRPLIVADEHRFRVFLWKALPRSEVMHARFILTDQCAVSIPDGLDCRIHSHANRTYWSLLSEEARQQLLQDYDPSMSPFKLLGDREFSLR